MRCVLIATLALPLTGCAAAVVPAPAPLTVPGTEARVEARCAAQGHQPSTQGWRMCVDAGGLPIATGPGSPWHTDEWQD